MRTRSGLLVLALSLLPASALAENLRVLVPAYQYPTLGTLWASLAAAAPQVPITAILDPANGPGTFVDPNYTAAVNTLRAAGGRVIGYVTTGYAARDTGAVLTDVRRHAAFYSIDGIFLDEMTADASPAHVNYMAALTAQIHAFRPGWSVTGNPCT